MTCPHQNVVLYVQSYKILCIRVCNWGSTTWTKEEPEPIFGMFNKGEEHNTQHEWWWVHHNLSHLRGILHALLDGTISSPPIHIHVMELYLVGKLTMVIWGRGMNNTTYFRKDDANRTEQKFRMVLELMSREDGKGYTIPQGVACITRPFLFWPLPNDQFWSEIVDCEYPLLII